MCPSFLPSKRENTIVLLYTSTSGLIEKPEERKIIGFPPIILKRGHERKNDKVSVLF